MFAEGAEGAFKGQGGLALSSGKFRSAGSPLMTIVDSGQLDEFDVGFSGSQFSRLRTQCLSGCYCMNAKTPGTLVSLQ